MDSAELIRRASVYVFVDWEGKVNLGDEIAWREAEIQRLRKLLEAAAAIADAFTEEAREHLLLPDDPFEAAQEAAKAIGAAIRELVNTPPTTHAAPSGRRA